MQLDKTVIIPKNDKKLARELFSSLIYDEDSLLVVVLGSGPKAKTATQCADKRARVVIKGFNRKVAWIHDPSILKKEIAALKPGKASLADENLSDIVAFSVSLADSVMDIIKKREVVNFIRIEKAYLKAGMTQ